MTEVQPSRPRARKALRHWAHRAALVMTLLLTALQGHAQSTAGKLVIGIDEEANTYGGILGRLLYAEISRRMGLNFELITFPQQRRSEMVDAGAIDGETSRVHAYGAAHPNLVRVEEVLIDLNFGLYSASPALRIQRLEDLAVGKLKGEYRRGVLFCEKTLKSVLPAEQVSDVTESLQGLKKLLSGRSDVYCDLDFGIITPLHDPEIVAAGRVRKLFDLGVIPTYPYLHKKHAELVPRMAAAIRKMKAEGLVEAYKLQAQREMGWLR